MGEPATVIDDQGNWYDTIVGDNTERAESMKAYETPESFFEAHDALVNKDWRADLAGDDGKFLTTLQRFSEPADMGKSYRESQEMIRSGKLKELPGEESTDEDIAAYREANGIPAEAAGYLENLPEGVVIGEEDKEIFEDFMGVLHGQHVAPGVAHSVIGWYNEFAEKEQEAQRELDGTQSQEANDQLRNSAPGLIS